ncbi:hypothetical protein E4U41_005161 [Claviceps citrina]|nr:hypothetical protein E4U41_005161 [Claviceps citrina]
MNTLEITGTTRKQCGAGLSSQVLGTDPSRQVEKPWGGARTFWEPWNSVSPAITNNVNGPSTGRTDRAGGEDAVALDYLRLQLCVRALTMTPPSTAVEHPQKACPAGSTAFQNDFIKISQPPL